MASRRSDAPRGRPSRDGRDGVEPDHPRSPSAAAYRDTSDSHYRYSQQPTTPSDAASKMHHQQQDLHPVSSREGLAGGHGLSAPRPAQNRQKTSLRDKFADAMERRRLKKMRKKNPLTYVSWRERLGQRLAALYQLIVIETILRQRPLPPSQNGRIVPLNPSDVGNRGLIDERSGRPYISNFIRSSRYTLWSFIPAQLLFQFSKLGNFYFLVVGIIQMIPGLSTVGRWTTIAPLGVFVALSMAKEGYDDWRRYELDKVENRSPAWVLAHGVRANPSNRPRQDAGKGLEDEEKADDDLEAPKDAMNDDREWIKIRWQDVQVGDVVRLRRDDAVPADIALLHATGPNGIAYIDTMALDGETNLKSKQACPLFMDRCATLDGLLNTNANVVSEDPNMDLYSYEGRGVVGDETLPLTMSNVVYRGSTLRNTTMAVGLVINSGEECKIRMNANKNVKAKKPRMQGSVNKMILAQIVLVLAITGGLTGGYYIWKNPHEITSFYLRGASVPFAEIFFGHLVMFNTLIPISLYISLEIVKVGQFLLLQDADMYDPISDTPIVVNTTTILENLGQVDYIFSDKTGTLTENIMHFRKMSVAGLAFLHDMNEKRAEEERNRKIEASKRSKKSKDMATMRGKATALVSKVVSAKRLPPPEEDDDFEAVYGVARVQGATSTSTQWKPSVQPDEEPEMKTEDLIDFLRRNPTSPFAEKAKAFLLLIALCHTCLPEKKEDGSIDFQAANPDELALVEAARDLGLILVDRPINGIKLQTTDEDGNVRIETYQVLDVIEFSSKRKRMSIIVRMPDGRICIICKGADNVIRERLRLQHLADEKAADVSRRASHRMSFEQGRALRRQSYRVEEIGSARNSMGFGHRSSGNPLEGTRPGMTRTSSEMRRISRPEDFTAWLRWRETEAMETPDDVQGARGADPTRESVRIRSPDDVDRTVDEKAAFSEDMMFERCFQHVDSFASEGLRTLLYGYRYIDEESYTEWKEIYHEAETSLVDRQDRMEEASDLIEQKFELAGATAIEDKLQQGVPETIEKLRRANIKVWMLTGDKRETAINIGHSARLCKPFSSIYILDSTLGNLDETLRATIAEVRTGTVPHAVLVVDGKTLGVIDDDGDLSLLFYELVVLVDSVICCRASPSQKSHMVRSIRRFVPHSMTMAVGDGANDVGMILESQVGIGISGREGLQAARISDFAIAQFRFLQKLILVHGRWNYHRTGRYILATFWKEAFFYFIQAHFQRLNGYTGTSLYENWSLTVFNVLFTSLAVIIPGIFEQDLSAQTLLAVPELYTYGQKHMAFNAVLYLSWVVMGTIGSVIVFYPIWRFYQLALFTSDTSLYAMGAVTFTVSVLFINIKLLILEMHTKTIVVLIAFTITVGGWFMWLSALSETYVAEMDIYLVANTFIDNFGATLLWWAMALLGLTALMVLELSVQAIRRVYFPNDVDIMQRIEKDQRAAKLKSERASAAEKGHREDMELQDVGGSGDVNASDQYQQQRVRDSWPIGTAR